MKKILAITFLNFFILGGLTLTIPLFLLEKNIDLTEIGIIISILPLLFFAFRLLLAAIADLEGWAKLYLLINWPASLFSTLIYFIANSTLLFLLGKIIEAVKESSYWAINRTAIFSLSPQREEKEATKNMAILSFSTAIGSAVSGLGVTYFGFSFTFGIFIIASTILGIPAALLCKNETMNSKLKTHKIVNLLDPRGRERKFWFISLTLLFFSLARYPLITLLLPAFMSQQLGYNYIEIGLAYMTFSITSASVTFFSLKSSLDVKRVLLQIFIALSASFLLKNSNNFFLLPFLAYALALGLGIGFFEAIIAKVTKNRLSVSIDIGFLHIPMRLAEFTSVLFAGFFAQSFGYMPLFVSSGIFFTIFSVLSFYILSSKNSEVL